MLTGGQFWSDVLEQLVSDAQPIPGATRGQSFLGSLTACAVGWCAVQATSVSSAWATWWVAVGVVCLLEEATGSSFSCVGVIKQPTRLPALQQSSPDLPYLLSQRVNGAACAVWSWQQQ